MGAEQSMPPEMQARCARESIATRIYRMLNRSSRVTSTIKLVRNTSARKQHGCVLCGATCPGYSARHQRTKQSLTWESEHDCTASWLASHGVAGKTLDKAVALAFEARNDREAENVLGDLLIEVVGASS